MAIYIIGKLKQKNDGKFALLDAADVEMPDGSRLSDKVFVTKVSELQNDSNFVKAEALEGLVKAEDLSGFLTEEEANSVVNGVLQVVNNKADKSVFEPITQDEYDALVANGTVDLSRPYFIKKENE